jgi:hypothetical protein
MITQICINESRGQDCLEFTRVGSGPSKNWNLDKVFSNQKVAKSIIHQPNTSLNSINQGLFYSSLSAHGQLV